MVARKAAVASVQPSDRIADYGMDAICEDIADGRSLTDIGSKISVSVGMLLYWFNKVPERSARVREARAMAAQLWDEKAEQVLLNADVLDVPRARELASHYRWRASKIAPKVYGDKLELSGEIGIKDVPDDAVESRLAVLLRAAGIVGIIGGEGTQEGAAPDQHLLPGQRPAAT